MSWCPVVPILTARTRALYERCRARIDANVSGFPQPSQAMPLGVADYDLFACQIPHDETLRYHATVGVLEALDAVLGHAERRGRRLVVKGHPANPKSMAPMRARTEASPVGHWVEDVSIHTALAGAGRVYLVNSGVGFEAILHGRPVTAFGRAEYEAAVAHATLDPATIAAAEAHAPAAEIRMGLIGSYLDHCVDATDPESFAGLEAVIAKLAT